MSKVVWTNGDWEYDSDRPWYRIVAVDEADMKPEPLPKRSAGDPGLPAGKIDDVTRFKEHPMAMYEYGRGKKLPRVGYAIVIKHERGKVIAVERLQGYDATGAPVWHHAQDPDALDAVAAALVKQLL